MWKKKLLLQATGCIIIILIYTIAATSNITFLDKASDLATAAASKHYTLSDIFDKGKAAVSVIVKAPSVVTSYVLKSQEMHKYNDPVDDYESGKTVSVYAVRGGQVIETGENNELGLYLKIRHEDSESIYGNCKKIYVKEGEHVRKGQVIASFYKDKNGDFYYDLKQVEP